MQYQSTGVADLSITNTKLSDNFVYRGLISDGATDSKTLNKSGYYIITTQITDLPSGIANDWMYLEVSTSGRWVIQRIFEKTQGSSWYRTLDLNTPTNNSSWLKVGKIADKQVVQNNLADTFNFRRTLNLNEDLNALKINGIYISTQAILNKPSVANDVSIINVYGNGNFVIQEYSEIYSNKSWKRMCRINNNEFEQWREIPNNTDIDNKISAALTSVKPNLLSGKKIVCFGDSITGNYNYPSKITSLLGCTTYNVGFGGCQMTAHWDTDYDKFSMSNLVDSLFSGDWTSQNTASATIKSKYGHDVSASLNTLKGIDFNTIDIITIFYGTNDYASGIRIGTNNDVDKTTFKGALNYIVNKIQSKYPKIDIMFITPMWRQRLNASDNKESDTNPNTDGTFLITYVDSIVEIANKNHLACLDLYRNLGITKYNYATFLTDGLHPNLTDGTDRLATKISKFLCSN